jgi:predicted transport protein
VISQGLFYLDWLMDHRAEFEMLVMEKLGPKSVEEVDWDSPRLMCIAGGFTRYDVHAVAQIDRNIELIRYARYSDDLVLFERVNSPSTPPEKPKVSVEKDKAPEKEKSSENTALTKLDKADPEFRDLYHALSAFVTSLGDDVTMKERRFYVAYRRLKNFCCVEIHVPNKELLVFLKVDPTTVELKPGFARDVRDVGHFGTASRHPGHRLESHTQKARSRRPSCGRFDRRRSKASCCRSARFSSVRSVRVLSAARRAPNRASTRDIALHGLHVARPSSRLGIEFWQTTRVGSAVPLGWSVVVARNSLSFAPLAESHTGPVCVRNA